MLNYAKESNYTATPLFSDLVHNTNNAVIITDLDGSIKYCNQGFTKITGYSFDEVKGKKPGAFLHGPDTNPETIDRISRKINNLERVNESILNYHKDGSSYWLQLDIYPIFDEMERPSHFMAIESVITEHKLKEKEAEDKKARLEENISYAKKLQQALFRQDAQDQHFFEDHFIFDQPKDEVGGDFYIFDSIQNKKVVFVGDCTGHGASGAILTALCTSTVKAYLQKYKTLSPSMIIEKSQEKVQELLEAGKVDMIRDNMEATLMFIDESKNEIKLATTSQELYYIGEDDNVKIKSQKIKVNGKFEIQDITIKYKPGSMIYAASDGFKDQFGEANGKKYSSRKLQELLSNIYTKQGEEQHKDLKMALNSWKGTGESQTDDVLVVGIRL
ncbi:MAG: hypothetical protein CMP48_23375 [Rickettsiales bacterium]|nr:hypothetical protein [Rickettsiales bacterium]